MCQIRRLVTEAQEKRAAIERLLNAYAKFYTPIALLLGLGLWVITHDVLRSITMLIIFCPCVMVLATPTALVASIGNAALRGSLVKMGSTIEALAKVDVVCFDKTGTVTDEQPRLVRTISLNGLGEAELLRLCAEAEKFSEHSVLAAAEAKGIEVPDPVRAQGTWHYGQYQRQSFHGWPPQATRRHWHRRAGQAREPGLRARHARPDGDHGRPPSGGCGSPGT